MGRFSDIAVLKQLKLSNFGSIINTQGGTANWSL